MLDVSWASNCDAIVEYGFKSRFKQYALSR